MAIVFRTLIVGFSTACATLTSVSTTVASVTPPNVIEIDVPWVDSLLPTDAEIELLLSDDDFEFVKGAVLVSEPPAAPRLLPDIDIDIGDGPSRGDAGSTIDREHAFSLHSNPGAEKVIFLDFDGHVAQGTAWNDEPGSTLVLGEYSREIVGHEIDGFTQRELDGIFEIWQRVADDFAPWPVDVTTEDPGDAALYSVDRSVDTRYGAHVVITHDSDWYGGSGGVAYIGTIGQRYYSPAFVFSDNLPEYAGLVYGGSPKLVAEAASHEVGHNLGLSHDGAHDSDPHDSTNDGTPYFGGHRDSEWAPIMGVGYDKAITQWSKGDYPNANQPEDDIAVIDAHLHGRGTGPTTSSASLGPGDTTVVATLSDGGAVDSYQLVVTEGPVDVALSKTHAWGNLLAELVVTDVGAGTSTLVTPDDPTEWAHHVDGLAPGTYTVDVRSIGWDDPTVDGDDFPAYGSMGQYVLSVDAPDGVPAVTPTTTAPTTTTPTTTPTTVAPTTTVPTTPPPPAEADANRLAAIDPVRLLDTRSPGAVSDRVEAGENIRIPLAGVNGISSDTRAAVVNVVAVRPSGNGYLSVTPCTDVSVDERTSSLNYVAGSNIANSTIATLSDDGSICIYSSASTHVVLDVTGAIGPSGAAELSDTTVRRIVDTRIGDNIPRRLDAGEIAVVSLDGDVAHDTTAISVNVTAVAPATGGYLSIDNCAARDVTASLNFSTGETRGNNGIFALGADQTLCVQASTAVDVIIDLTGEFGDDGYTYLPAEPVRLLDTRASAALTPGSSTSFEVPTPADGVTPVAASINIASAGHPRSGFITSWNCGSLSTSSALNPVAGQVTANGALAPLNPGQRSCLFHQAGGNLVVDLNGWWV
jgi:Metallo-peptidase family M12B Reprolysin-like